MPLNSSVRANGEIIVTSGDRLTIENAADFSRVIRDALKASDRVAIEFDPEVVVDITGVQILCSACKSAAQGGKIFSYRGMQPHALKTIIESSGAERHTACKHNNDSTCIWFGGAN
jgi:anti-anti-sigma regulatory factor